MEGFGLSEVPNNFHAHVLPPSNPAPLRALQTSQSQRISQRQDVCTSQMYLAPTPSSIASTAASREHKPNSLTSRFLRVEMPFGKGNNLPPCFACKPPELQAPACARTVTISSLSHFHRACCLAGSLEMWVQAESPPNYIRRMQFHAVTQAFKIKHH